MGQRTLKRVPVDFDHPLKQVWPGYLSPQPRPCPAGRDCINGSNPDGAWLEHWTHLLLVAGSDPTHPWVKEVPFADRPPSERMAELSGGLAGRPQRGPGGHDAIDRFSATQAIIAAAGLPDDWGRCPGCNGFGYHPDDEAAQDAWEPSEPPTGDGWQLWETTSEGSPVSPVFESAEELAAWCAANATLFGTETAPYEAWLEMFREDMTEVGSTMMFVSRG